MQGSVVLWTLVLGHLPQEGMKMLTPLRSTSLATLAAAFLIGCSTEKHAPQSRTALSEYNSGNYSAAVSTLRPLAAKTDEDYVLNNVRLGSAALCEYDLKEAEAAFLRAYEVINSTGVNDAGRATAAALFAEKAKVWKGEPFERAMVNFYLGLCYYMQEDYNNARAAFENALFKLRDYGEQKTATAGASDPYKEVESDFTIAYVMLAKCHQRLGDAAKAKSFFDRVARLRPELRPLIDRASGGSNVLLVVDHGVGPKKTWQYDNSVVAFVPKPAEAGAMAPAHLVVTGKPINLQGASLPPIDLLALAQEKRWQSIDTIRLTKSAIGTGMMAAGAYEGTRDRDDRDEGTALGLLLGGALLKSTATGDVRHWEMLPRTTYILPLRLTPGRHDVTVTFADGSTQTLRGIVAPPEQKEATYYLRPSRIARAMNWPPPAYTGPFAPAPPKDVVPAPVKVPTAQKQASAPPAKPATMPAGVISRSGAVQR
jgi:tetratricopeptide (TPR) repeat protein